MALLDRLGAWWERRGTALEQKQAPYLPDYNVVYIPPLIHGPGATEMLEAGWRRDGNSAVFACLSALAEGFCEAPLRLFRVEGPGDREELPDHPLQALLNKPNPYMTSLELWHWVQWAKHLDGNAYVRKVRQASLTDTRSAVVELWPISPSRIEIRSEPRTYISAYRYHYAAGLYEDIDPANILHFRLGIDDRDHRRGLGPIKRLLREIGADDRASAWADNLLRNGAVPGLLAKQKGTLTQTQAEQLKLKIASIYGGENVGAVGVIDQDGDLVQFGFNPEQMQLTELHRVPEERVSAVLRVPAIIAGLGAGLDQATYSNARQLRELFTEQTLIGLWRRDAAKVQTHLVPDFTDDPRIVAEFDISEVRALQEDENEKVRRVTDELKAGGIMLDEMRADLGYDPLPDGKGRAFYVPVGVTYTLLEDLGAEPEPVPASPPGEGNIRALPTAARRGDLEAKARGLSVPFARLRQRMAAPLTADLTAFLAEQRARVLSRLPQGQAGVTAWALKQGEDFVPLDEDARLRALLHPYYADMLAGTHAATQAALGVAFGIPDYAATQYLREAGQLITAINETTRNAVRAALVAGAQNAEGVDAIARRIRQLPEFDAKRARVVARTELGSSQIEASFTSYRQSNVVAGVRVLDGDYDAECAERNGRVFSLAAAHGEPRLLHPNCTAAWLPVTDAAEVEGAA